jgi:hypothetical protein
MRTRAILGGVLAGAVATLGFMIHAADRTRPSWWISFVLFAAWALLPYAAMGAAARLRPSNRSSRSVLLAAAVLLSGLSALVLYDVFVAHPDAQSGLVVLILPLWQLVGLAPFVAASRYLARRGAGAWPVPPKKP